MNDTAQALGRLNAQLLAIAKQLDVAADIPDGAPHAADLDHEANARRLTTAKAWQRASAIRRDQFDDGEALFADPAWELLLDLYIEQARGRPTSVSSACVAARVPTTTGLRWLVRLEKLGLIERTQDASDKRRIYLALTSDARARLERSLDAAMESDRRLGLTRLQSIQ